MRHIVFVDDEPNVLQGIRRMLRPLRQEWSMTFCSSGPEALEFLDTKKVDVIVTDMRMPEMDGAELLSQVKERHPSVVRIVLSGQSKKESTLKSVGVAHQFLAKPCNPEILKKTIDDALGLRALMANDALQQVISNIASVPSVPALYSELVEEVQHEDTSTQRVGEIVAKDPGMTTNILHLVNSAFFGLPRRATNAVQATALLGVDTIRTLVLSLDVFSQFDRCVAGGISPIAIQEHSMQVASEAKRIGLLQKVGREETEAILMAGLLHDVGKLVLAQNLPDEYQRVMSSVTETHVTLPEAEASVLGTTHADVGGYLLGLWGLPDAIVEAITLHHSPEKSAQTTFSPLTAVHVANAIVNAESSPQAACDELNAEYLARLELTDRIEVWLEKSDECATTTAGATHEC